MRTFAASDHAHVARALIEQLQQYFVEKLTASSQAAGGTVSFEPVEWLRDDGRHGGGVRYVAGESPLFNRGSVNMSQVHYDDLPDKRLSSATALSCIIHPANPRAPSMHMHISWTEMRQGPAYWRMMADLNPAIAMGDDTDAFAAALKTAAPAQYAAASAQGDRYFFIPALDRHRGVTHFYLEDYKTDDLDTDRELAKTVGTATIDVYTDLLKTAMTRDFSNQDRAAQLAYHTLYLFQVLTLDRGTTSGLLVHNQNDVGILGSLPSHVDGTLLASWGSKLEAPQDALLTKLCEIVGSNAATPITPDVKQRLAQAVRAHYQAHPEALSMQASGHVVPPTVQNHQ